MAAGHSPLAQFDIIPLKSLEPIFYNGINLSMTNSALWMLIGVGLVTLFYVVAMQKKALVPSRIQSLGEVVHEFVQDIVHENAGHNAQKFFPFIFTIFLFVLAMNLGGMLPYSFTPTSHIIITLGLGALVFLIVVLAGLIVQGPVAFLKHFAPEGVPLLLLPLIVLIELVSFLARPFSLAIRLAANMTAGHTLMKVIAGFVLPLGLFGVAPVLFLVFMTGFEIFIAILQAYVFALLSSIYLGEQLADHH